MRKRSLSSYTRSRIMAVIAIYAFVNVTCCQCIGNALVDQCLKLGIGGRCGGVGMDWLLKLRAKIVCYEKIVQIPLSNRSILEVHREHPEGNLKQLKTIKANEPKLEDILIVRNFPGVF
ncbi:hypothetical protein Tco_0185617, partial [Tanacetum coccineum]